MLVPAAPSPLSGAVASWTILLTILWISGVAAQPTRGSGGGGISFDWWSRSPDAESGTSLGSPPSRSMSPASFLRRLWSSPSSSGSMRRISGTSIDEFQHELEYLRDSEPMEGRLRDAVDHYLAMDIPMRSMPSNVEQWLRDHSKEITSTPDRIDHVLRRVLYKGTPKKLEILLQRLPKLHRRAHGAWTMIIAYQRLHMFHPVLCNVQMPIKDFEFFALIKLGIQQEAVIRTLYRFYQQLWTEYGGQYLQMYAALARNGQVEQIENLETICGMDLVRYGVWDAALAAAKYGQVNVMLWLLRKASSISWYAERMMDPAKVRVEGVQAQLACDMAKRSIDSQQRIAIGFLLDTNLLPADCLDPYIEKGIRNQVIHDTVEAYYWKRFQKHFVRPNRYPKIDWNRGLAVNPSQDLESFIVAEEGGQETEEDVVWDDDLEQRSQQDSGSKHSSNPWLSLDARIRVF